MINGKAADYKQFLIGNERGLRGEEFLTRKWVDKVSRLSDRMIVKLWVQVISFSTISDYAPPCGLDDSQRDNFYDRHTIFP